MLEIVLQITTLFLTGDNRFLIVYKKDVKPFILTLENATTFTLSETSIQNISDLLASDPLVENEKQNIFIRQNDTSGHAHLPFMFGDSRAKAKVTVPPLTSGTGSLNAVRQSLPIFEHRDEILAAIQQHQVVVISGETGLYPSYYENKAIASCDAILE